MDVLVPVEAFSCLQNTSQCLAKLSRVNLKWGSRGCRLWEAVSCGGEVVRRVIYGPEHGNSMLSTQGNRSGLSQGRRAWAIWAGEGPGHHFNTMHTWARWPGRGSGPGADGKVHGFHLSPAVLLWWLPGFPRRLRPQQLGWSCFHWGSCEERFCLRKVYHSF